MREFSNPEVLCCLSDCSDYLYIDDTIMSQQLEAACIQVCPIRQRSISYQLEKLNITTVQMIVTLLKSHTFAQNKVRK